MEKKKNKNQYVHKSSSEKFHKPVNHGLTLRKFAALLAVSSAAVVAILPGRAVDPSAVMQVEAAQIQTAADASQDAQIAGQGTGQVTEQTGLAAEKADHQPVSADAASQAAGTAAGDASASSQTAAAATGEASASSQAAAAAIGEASASSQAAGTGSDAVSASQNAAGTSMQTAASNGLPLSAENYVVLGNVIGAVETGGQIYGKKDYTMYIPAFYASPYEYTCTLGWCSCYGAAAEQLIQLIHDTDPVVFASLDPDGIILAKLSTDWVADRWNPDDQEKQILINLISSDVGRACQDQMFYKMITADLLEGQRLYGLTDAKALMMYAEIELLGGSKAVQRIFNRCNGNYDVFNILNCLFADFDGNMKGTLVGSPMYWQRHLVCATYINYYAK